MPAIFSKQTYSQQLADKLEKLIRSGRWPAGLQTPPIRKVAEQYLVSARTAHLALRDLQEKGLLTRLSSGRTVVSEDIKEIETDLDNVIPVKRRDSSAAVQQIAMLGAHRYRSVADSWAGQIFIGAEESLIETGQFCTTSIHSAERHTSQRAKHMVRQLEQFAPRLSGAIIFQSEVEIERTMVERLDKLGLPWIMINRPTSDFMYNFVSADNSAIGRTAGRLFMLERRDPIWVLDKRQVSQSGSVSHGAKVTGLLEAYMQAGEKFPDIKYLPCADAGFEHGLSTVKRQLQLSKPPRAIYATGDFLALGGMRACQEAGLNIPDDVWIVGTTGLEAARLSVPALTVIPQPMREIGQIAGNMLVRMIQTGERRLPGKKVKSKLIIRGSTDISKDTREILNNEGLVE